MRYTVAAVGFLIILARIVFPAITFDNISLTILIFSSIVLLIPDIGSLIHRISKLKVGNVEIELQEMIKDLAIKSEVVDEQLDQEELKFDFKEVEELIETSLSDQYGQSKSAIMHIAGKIEQEILALLNENELPTNPRLSVQREIEHLSKIGILEKEHLPLFRDFWTIRNAIVHGQGEGMKSGYLIDILQIGARLLRIIRAKRKKPYEN